MFVAKDEAGNRVSIKHACRESEYFCPVCGESLIQRHGTLRADHFSHKADSKCLFGYPMTEWHWDWQNRFPEDCREVVFANDSGDIRRADIVIGNSVIEFQHSGILYDEIVSRTKFHRCEGRNVCWVFDRTGKSMTELISDKTGDNRISYLLGSPGISKKIMNALFESDCHILILDYGNACVILGNFKRGYKGDYYASVGYVFSKSIIVDMMLRFDDMVMKFGNDWSLPFVESYRDWFSAKMHQLCVDVYKSAVSTKCDMVHFGRLFDMKGKYVLARPVCNVHSLQLCDNGYLRSLDICGFAEHCAGVFDTNLLYAEARFTSDDFAEIINALKVLNMDVSVLKVMPVSLALISYKVIGSFDFIQGK